MARLVLVLVLLVATPGCFSKQEEAPPTATPPPTPPPTNATAPVELTMRLTGAWPVNIRYDPATAEVASGALVNVTFTNSDTNPVGRHDWVLEGVDGAATEVIAKDATSSTSFVAPAPGEYAYYCSVGDHRSQGMEGKLIVK